MFVFTYSDTHTNLHTPSPPPPYIPKLNKSPIPSRAFTSTHLLEILSLPFPYDQIINFF